MSNRPHNPSVEPWEQILQLEAQNDAKALTNFVDGLTPSETARALSRLNPGAQERLVAMLDAEHGAMVLHEVMEQQAADLLDQLSPAAASTLLQELPSNEKADILGDLDSDAVEAILHELPREQAASTKALLAYAQDCAGGLMSTEVLSFPDHWTVSQLIEDFDTHHQTYADYKVQYAFLTNASNKLSGVLNFRNVLLAPRSQLLSDLMVKNPLAVSVDDPLDDLIEVFEKHEFLGVPVTGESGQLLGLIRRSQVMEAAEQRASASFLRASGIVGGEELRSMPLRVRATRRLSWLSVNIGLNVIAASVIALYQDTLASVIALAVFLPIISDMSGCSGNQAVAVSIRELT